MKKKSFLNRLFPNNPAGEGNSNSEAAGTREYVAEQLEARILYSAAPAEMAAPEIEQEVVVDDAAQAEGQFESTDGFGENQIPVVDATASPEQLVSLTSFDHLSNQEIETLANAAVERWKAADLTAEQLEALEAIEISLVDLEGLALGEADGYQIEIDIDAAGSGWYVDATPFTDDEFDFAESSTAFRDTDGDAQYGMDLLTVMMHEMGHVLGLEDIYDSSQDTNLMHFDLAEGQRILPMQGQAEGATPGSIEGPQQLNAVNPSGADSATRGNALEDAVDDIEGFLPVGYFGSDGSTAGTDDPDYEINLDAGQTYAIDETLVIRNRTVNVVINGNGATIDALNLVRAFDIRDDSNVILNDLTIINGQTTSDGGGMYIDNANVTLNNVSFLNNVTTQDGNSQGAAIYAQGHSTTLTLLGDVSFENNISRGDGGALAIGQHVVVDGTAANSITFTNNRAGFDLAGTNLDDDEHGGAIWAFEHADIKLHNVTMDGNSATGVGGAMYITNNADIQFTSDTASSLINNFAQDDGGAFYIADASTIKLGTVNIENNTANLGNGGGFRSVHRETIVTIDGGTLERNTAGVGDGDGSGGGFWNQGTVNITGVDIQDNLSYNTGGGFYSGYEGAKVNLTDVNILTNTAEDSAGGFRVDNGDVIFTLDSNTETQISNNRVGVDLDGTGAEVAILDDKTGGGFYANRRSNVQIENGIIQDNTSTGHGGGFWASDETTVTITNGKIDSNEITPNVANNDERGGGFWISGKSTVTLDDTDVTNNTAARQGGGFFVGGMSATVNINDADISGNTGNNGLQNGVHGGGFYTEGAVNLTRANVTGNFILGEGTEDNHGGGFATAGGGGIVTGKDSNITNNEAWTHGGGWYGTDGSVFLTGGTISGNKVGGLGGSLVGDGNSNGVGAAAYLVSEGTAVLEGVTVENHTSESHGGAFYVATSHYLELGAGTVIQNNSAGIHTVNALGEGTVVVDGTNGGGFYATDDSRVKIDGATIQNNISENEGGGFMMASDRNLLEIASGTIDSNTASSSNGGGFRNAGTVVFSGAGVVNITNNVTLKGNDGSGSADNVGAGFYTSGGSSLVVTGTLDNGITGTGRDYTAGTAVINVTGNTAFGRGGGFYLSDGDMDIRGTAAGDINISNNGISTSTEVGGEKRGGGFWVSGGGRGANVRIDNGNIANNFTPNDGGGFYTRDGSTVTLNQTDILNNTAESQVVNRGGGGFHADSGEDLIVITGGRIEGNIAGHNNTGNIRVRGGGFLTSGKVELHGGVQILNNEVAESTTAGADRRGGGASVDGTGWIHSTDATFDGNQSFHVGAGIYTEGKITAEGTGLSVLNSSFTTTDQRREGAGVYFTGSSSADWNGGTISNNVSTYHGAGVRVDGVADVTFTNVTISNNRTVHHATDADTNAVGAGIYAEGSTRLTLIDSTVSDNTAEGRGGGLYIDDTILTLRNATISNNLAGVEFDEAANTFVRLFNANGNEISREGGGIWASGEAVIDAEGGEISGNNAWGGGGLEFRNNVVAVFDGTTLSGNVATQGGGFRTYNDVDLSFVNGATIEQNIAWNSSAGGGFTENQSVFTLQDSTVQHNITQVQGTFGSDAGQDGVGAGLYFAGDTHALVERSSIHENYAQGRGGGIYSSVDQDGSVRIIDSSITNNRTIRGGDSNVWRGRAGGISMQNNTGTIDITGSLISGNISAGDAGGVRVGRGTLNMDNSTVSGNIAGRDFGNTTVVALNDAGINGNALDAINFIKAQSVADEANFFRSRNQNGGGIGAGSEADATVTVNLNHVTITENESTGGAAGGLYQWASTGGSATAYSKVTIENSILFNNYRDSDANVPGVNPSIRDLQQSSVQGGGFVDVAETNIIGASTGTIGGNTAGIITTDPVLGALADNGGATLSHAIDAGGAAEDAATNSSVFFDQRGGDRTGGVADLGAIELEATVPTLTIVNVNETSHGAVGEQASFTIDLSAGSNLADLGVTISGGTTPPTANIVADPDGVADRYLVTFTPTEQAVTLTIDIALGGGPVQRSFDFEVGTSLIVTDIDGLHAAIAAFNSGSTDMTVTLAASTTAYDFSLATDGSVGDLDITNRDNTLVLVGNGASEADTVIDAANTDRVFEVNSFSHLVLRNLTVTRGQVAEHGAGIRVSNAYVTLDDVILEANTGDSAGDTNANRVGAGMYITGHSVVNANNVTFDKNTTHGRGGGFYIDHYSEINFTGDTVISNNETTRTTDAQAHGGGFWASGTATVNIEGNFDIVDNVTTSGGGAFFVTDAATIDGSGATTIDILRNNQTNNHTTSQWAAHGQGFWAYNNSTVKLANAVIDSNGNSTIGQEGGGFRASQYATVEIDGGSITNNLTRTSGAGFRVSDLASVILTDVDISGNSAANGGSGGGFLSDAFTVVELNGGKLEQNYANNSGDGAGFYARGTVNITGVDIQNNETGGGNDAFGGAFFATGTRADINLTDVNILNNTSEDHGGGFWASDNAQVDFNLNNNSKVSITGNKIADTGDRNGRGGGFWASTEAKVNINAGAVGQSVDLNGNQTNQHGGAFSADGGHVTIVSGDKSEISGYDLTIAEHDGQDGGSGAGFFVGNLGKVNITNVDIKNNTADNGGGGFFSSYQSEVTLTDVEISGNTANTQGNSENNDNFRNGGGGFYSRGHVTLNNSVITQNVVETGAQTLSTRPNKRFDGGGFWAENRYGRIELNDTDVTDNVAQGNGGGFAVTDAELVINTTGADLSDTSTLTQISGNSITADARHGGGIYAEGMARLTLNGVNITGNSATNDGAGFMLTADATATINGSAIHNNVFADPDGTKTVAARDGAGFYVNSRATVNVNDSELRNSTATSQGGAFRADGADTEVNITGTKIYNNATTNNHGGAITTSGKLTLTNSDFGTTTAGTGNRTGLDATGNNNRVGGAIYQHGWGSETILNNTDINDQRAHGRGGAVYVSNGTFTSNDSDFKDNQVIASAREGGAIWAGTNARVTVNDGEISGNSATSHGGGITIGDSNASNGAVVTLNNVKLNNNTADNRGGGFWVNDTQSEVFINDSEINYNQNVNGVNTNRESGGGLYIVHAVATITDTTIKGNTASSAADDEANREREGGGIRIGGTGTNVTLTRVTVEENVGGQGAGIYNEGQLTLNDTLIRNNSSLVSTTGAMAQVGAGLFLESASENVFNNSVISGNTATGNGGGIYAGGRSTLELNSTSVTSNRTYDIGDDTNRVGGGMQITEDARVTLNQSVFDANEAHGRGGAIYNDGHLELYDSTISNNVALSDRGDESRGAGIWTSNINGNLIMDRTSVVNNVGGEHGAGIWAHEGDILIQNSTISGNTTGVAQSYYNDAGSGSYAGTSGGQGGAMWASDRDQDGAYIRINNTTIAFNSATSSAGGIRSNNVPLLEIQNSIIYNNVQDIDSTNSNYDIANRVTLVGENVLGLHFGTALDGNTAGRLTADPNLGILQDNGGLAQGADGTIGDSDSSLNAASSGFLTHFLEEGSSAIDAVTSSVNILDDSAGSLAVDAIGATRVGVGTAVDIGAIERPATNAPVAGDDVATTNEDTLLSVVARGVLLNDTDVESAATALVVANFQGVSVAVANGSNSVRTRNGATVVMSADGSYTYDPTTSVILGALNNGESIVDTFTYTVQDEDGLSHEATVSVTVTGVTDAPLVNQVDPVTTNEDSQVTVNVVDEELVFQGELSPDYLADMNRAGYSVDIHDDLAIIGGNRGHQTEQVFIYRDAGGGNWQLEATLTNPDGIGSLDTFGFSVAIDSDNERAYVGARLDDDIGSNRGAVYFFENDGSGNWSMTQKIGAGDANDEMGFSVDVETTTGVLVVGAPAEDVGIGDSGAVYVFTHDGGAVGVGQYTLQQTLKGDEPLGGAGATASLQQSDRLGENVAIDGNTIVVGHWRDDVSGGDSGAALVYAFDGTNWILQTIIEGNAAEGGLLTGGERLGFDVDISGDTVVLGAYLEDTGSGNNRGAVYIYQRNDQGDADVTNDTWSLLQIIDGDEAVPGLSGEDQFGVSVSIDGTRMIVGGHGDDQSFNNSGSAWIFERPDTDSQFDVGTSQRLNAGDAQANAEFGRQVAISGTNYLVGAHLHDAVATANGDNLDLINYGRAYIYNGEVGSAGSESILDLGASTFTEFSAQADFGFRMAVGGDIAVVGAPGGGKNSTDADTGAGQAYVYQRNDQGTDDASDDTWHLIQVLRNLDDDNDDAYGVGVAVSKDGTTIAIGADTHEDGGSNQGAVYIYELEDGEYVHKGRIRAADRENNDRMGRSVALNEDGSVLAVGVFDDHSSGLADSGSVRVYDVIGSTWTEFFTNGSVEDPGDQNGEILLAIGGAEGDEEFGRSVAISGNRIVVGEYLADDIPNNSGAAYVFEYNGTDWTTNATRLPDSSTLSNDDRFGRSVDIDGDTIVVGSYQDEATGGSNRGSATVYEWNGAAWVETALLEASDAASNDNFGLAVAVDGNHIVVGAYREDATATNAGAAYVFSKDSGGAWNELTKIDAPAGSAANANFGRSVNISDGTVIIGAPEADVLRASGINQVRLGAAYIYQITPISDAGLITVTSASAPKGSATVNPDGTITFDPRGAFDYLDPGDTEDVIVTYEIAGSDDLTVTSTGTVTVTVTGVNDTPTATDDSFTVNEDDASAVVGNVLGNDVDVDDSSSLQVDEVNEDAANVGTQFTTAGGGLVTVNANGDVTFDPNDAYESLADGENLVETFTYNVTDGLTQVVHNEKDGIIVGEATSFTDTDDYVAILESDGVANVNSMAGSRTGTFMQIPNGTGSSGSITVEDTNRPRFLEYKVNIASAGTYQLFVRATGYDGGSDSLYASITEYQDNAPGGNPDWYRFFIGGDTNFTWSGTGEVESTSGGAGTEVPMEFTLDAGVHTLRIMTREDGAAVDAFALRRTDSSVPVTEFTGDVAGPEGATQGTVTITVTGANDAPTVTANIDQTVNYTEDDASVAIDDIVISDVDNNEVVTATLTLADNNAGVLSTGTFGSVTSTYDSGTGVWTATGSVADVNAALADLSFTPAADYDQNTTISVSIDDGDEDGGGALTGTINLDVTAVNDAPVANDDTGAAVENGGAVIVDVITNDTDVENDTLAIITESVSTSAAGVTLTVVGNSISYDPSTTTAFELLAAGETTTDTFTYSVTDNNPGTLFSQDFEGAGSSLNAHGFSQFGSPTQVVQNAVWASDPFGSPGKGVWLQGNNPDQNGGFYTDVQGIAGETYTFGGTFRIEPNFIPNGGTVSMHLIYLDASGAEISRDSFDVGASGVPTNSFDPRSVTGTAAAGTVTVRSQVSWTTDDTIEVGSQTAVLIDNMYVTGPSYSTATVTMTITGTNDGPVATDDGNYASVWELGIDNNSTIEFEQEGPGSNAAPGDPNARDDDYYFAGTYAGVGTVAVDEIQGDGLNNGQGPQGFERALTNSDPVNRIHFNLPNDASDDNYRLLIDTVGSNFNSSSFDFEVLLNGNQIYSANVTSDGLIQIDFDGTHAVSGENTITLQRTDSNGGWFVFDYIDLQSNYVVTEDGAVTTQIGNVLVNDRDIDVNGTAPDDVITVVDVDSTAVAASGNTVITGTYGSLTIDANGAYTYTLDNGDTDTDALIGGQVVTESFVYTISDGTETTTATLSIQVNGADDNTAPTIVTAVAVNVAENETAVIDVNTNDAEDSEGSGLTYGLTGGADQALFTIDTNTGALSFLNGPDFENPTDVGGNNVYDVQVTVTDSGGLTDVQDIAVTVTNVDGSLSIGDAGALNEGDSGNTTFSFTVTRTGDTSGASSASYAVSGNGANAASADDFAGGVFATGTVSFADGETSKVITVDVTGDTAVENDEGFQVVLSAPLVNAVLVDDTGVATITNDDSSISIANAAPLAEGDSGSTAFIFTVTRTGDTSGASSATYTVSGDGVNGAAADDFVGGTFPTGLVEFAAGETTKDITINVQGDTIVETDEGFKVTLSSPTGTVIGNAEAVSTIINDEAVPAYYVDDDFSGTVGSTVITDADLGENGSQGAVFGVSAFTTIQEALTAAQNDGISKVIINGGTYNETISIPAGITVDITGPDTAQNVTISELSSVAGANIVIEGASTLTVDNTGAQSLDGLISGSGNLVKTGAGTLTISGNNTYAGSTSINEGTVVISNDNALGSDTGATNVASGAKLHLDGSGGDLTISEDITTNGGTGGGDLRNLAGDNTITGTVTIGANSDYRRNAGSLTFSGGINGTNTDLSLNGIFHIDTVPVDLGTGQLNYTSAGNNVANASEINVGGNTWGTTLINFGGYVQLGVDDALPTDSSLVYGWQEANQSSGTLDLNGFNQTIASVETRSNALDDGGDHAITDTTGSGTITVNQAGDTTFQGNLEGGMTLVKEGAGRLTLENLTPSNHSDSVSIEVNDGALKFLADSSIDPLLYGTARIIEPIPENITVNGALLEFEDTSGDNRMAFQTDTITFGPAGGGTVDFISGNYLFQGSAVSGGTVNDSFVSQGGAQNTITSSGGAAFLNPQGANTITFDVADGTDPSGIDLVLDINFNNGNLEKSGAGTLALTNGVNNITGDITINDGTLEVANSGALQSGSYAGNITNNGILRYTSDQDQTISGVISGSGSVEKNGPATLTLSGDNTYTGGTTLESGTLVVGHSNALGTGDVTMTDLDVNPVLQLTSGINVANNITIDNTGGNKEIVLDGVGAETAELSGDITINEITSGLPNGNFDVRTGDGDVLTLSGTISGPGRLNLANDVSEGNGGTVAISGNNTHANTEINAGVTAQALSATALGASATLEQATLEIGDGVTLDSGTALEISTTGANKVITLVSGATTGGIAGPVTVNEVDVATHADVVTGTGQTLTISGDIDGPGQLNIVAVDAASDNGGTVVLSGNNTHAEGTFINTDTTVQALSPTALGAKATLNGNFAILEIGDGVTIDASTTLTVTDIGSNKTIGLVGGSTSGNYAGDIVTEELSASNFDLRALTGETLTISGDISGAGTINSSDDGTVVLTGTNTYSGTTRVNLTGTLLVNGDNSGATGDVTVTNNATLGGTGTIGGAVSIEGNNGQLSPGDNGVGTLTLAGGLSYVANGNFLVDVDGTNDASDRADITGDLDISLIDLTINEISAADDPVYVIASYTGNITGTAFGSESGVPAGYDIVIDTANKQILLDRHDAPVANDDTNNITETGGATATENANVSGNAMANDTDADLLDDPATNTGVNVTGIVAGTAAATGNVGATVEGTYGDLVMAADGTYTYTLVDSRVDALDDTDVVTDVFTYLIDDGDGGSDSATLTVTVNGANDDPVATDENAAATEAGGIGNAGGSNPSGSVTMTDVDDSPTVTNISFAGTPFTGSTNTGGAVSGPTQIDGAYGTLTIDTDGSYSYAINEDAADPLTEGQIVHEVFTFTTGDGTGSDTGTIDITLTGDNDATEAVLGAGDTIENPMAVEQGTPVQLVEEVVVSDVDDTQMEEITITISPVLDDMGAPIAITDEIKDSAGNSLTPTVHGDGSVSFTMTGPFTPAQVKAEIEGLQYLSPNGSLENRTVSIRVGDGNDLSSPIVRSIELSPQQNNFVGIQSLFRDLDDRLDNFSGNRGELFVGVGGSLFNDSVSPGVSSATQATTPFIAGLVEPGSFVRISYIDQDGTPVTKTVKADQAGNFITSVDGAHAVTVVVQQPLDGGGSLRVALQTSFIFPELDLDGLSDDEILGMYFPLDISSVQALQDSLTPGNE